MASTWPPTASTTTSLRVHMEAGPSGPTMSSLQSPKDSAGTTWLSSRDPKEMNWLQAEVSYGPGDVVVLHYDGQGQQTIFDETVVSPFTNANSITAHRPRAFSKRPKRKLRQDR
eukprot:scaffold457921_cov15-Prasinocladus_malaysianus.AAC.1